MLTKIREKFTGGVAFAILALIGIPFLFLGYGSYDFLGGAFAAKVDGSEIGILEFEQAYRDQVEANPALAELPEEFRVQLREGVLQSLIGERLPVVPESRVGQTHRPVRPGHAFGMLAPLREGQAPTGAPQVLPVFGAGPRAVSARGRRPLGLEPPSEALSRARDRVEDLRALLEPPQLSIGGAALVAHADPRYRLRAA